MVSLVYSLCALTSLMCAFLLLRAYTASRSSVLLWSGLCFLGLALSNVVLVVDKLIYPEFDLTMWRLGITLCSLMLLMYGLIYNEK